MGRRHPFAEGGLAIRDLRVCNAAANMRHIWNFISNSSTLWTDWIRKHLIKDNNFWILSIPQNASWCWRNIFWGRTEAAKFSRHIVGNGERTLFWKDPWHPAGILIEKFPKTSHTTQFYTRMQRSVQFSSMVNGSSHRKLLAPSVT